MSRFNDYLILARAEGKERVFDTKMAPFRAANFWLHEWIAEYFKRLRDDELLYREVFDFLKIEPHFYGQPKSFESVYKKVFRGELQEEEIFNLNDLARARIICNCLSQTQFVFEKLPTWLVQEKDCRHVGPSKDTRRAPRVSGYRGINLFFAVPVLVNGASQYVECEVQIRTVVEHAWSELEHYLVYKNYELKKSEHPGKDFVLRTMPLVSDVLDGGDQLLDEVRRQVKVITPHFDA